MSKSGKLTKAERIKYRVLWGECPEGKLMNPKTGRCIKLKKPTNRLTWMQALKLYNKPDNGKWCTPRKGTVDWSRVKQMMKDGGVEQSPTKFQVAKTKTFIQPVIHKVKKQKRKITPMIISPSDGPSIPFGQDIPPVVFPGTQSKKGPSIKQKENEMIEVIDDHYEQYTNEREEAIEKDDWSVEDEDEWVLRFANDIVQISRDFGLTPPPDYLVALAGDFMPNERYSKAERDEWVASEVYQKAKDIVNRDRMQRMTGTVEALARETATKRSKELF